MKSQAHTGSLTDNRQVPDWSGVVGGAYVLTDPADRAAWGRRTFGPDVPVSAIVRPGSAAEVAGALRMATQHRHPVHPVSRGANWGMGSRAPMQSGAAILDLSRLTTIEEVDFRHGVVRVEPGVTFQMLADYLTERGSRFFVPEIGGSPDASVLANALDRGDGALGDRWASLSDLAVVLPDGRVVETGFAGRSAHRLAGLHEGAAGPVIDGLFSQSNLGVVVAGCLRLEPMPENLAIFSVRVDAREAMPDMLETLREMQVAGAVRDRSVTLWNGVKFLARENPRVRYDESAIRQAATETWMMSGYLQGETEALLTQRGNWVLERFAAAGVQADASLVRIGGQWLDGCDGLLGSPSPRNLRTAYWSEDGIPEVEAMDPDADGCGLLWLCIAFPFDGEVVAQFALRAATILGRYGIDFNFGAEAASFRCLLSYVSMSYRRDGPDADACAVEAYSAVLEEAEAMGLAPYRLANGLARSSRSYPDPLDDYLAALRQVADPAGILSKGRSGIG